MATTEGRDPGVQEHSPAPNVPRTPDEAASSAVSLLRKALEKLSPPRKLLSIADNWRKVRRFLKEQQ